MYENVKRRRQQMRQQSQTNHIENDSKSTTPEAKDIHFNG